MSQTDADGKVVIKVVLDDEPAKEDAKGLQKQLEKMGKDLDKVGMNASKYVTAPIMAIGGAAMLSAKEFAGASKQMQNALGLTKEEAEVLKDSVKTIYTDGFGESVEDVTNAITKVKESMKDLTGEELETATKSALTLANTLDADVSEVARATKNLMTNFGISSEKAFDMMAHGAQNGLNFSNELFDNLAEYAPLWSDMGFSAEEMFGIIEAGAKNGVYNLDYMNDVMKEFGIRIADGSKSTSDAFEGLTKESQDMFNAFIRGEATAADMAKQIAADLSTLDDQVERNQIGVALFGTKWEDLGGDVVLSMLTSGKAIEGFEGTMKEMNETSINNFTQLGRAVTTALEPLGQVLLELANDVLPYFVGGIKLLSGFLENTPKPILVIISILGLLAAAVGPVLLVVAHLLSSFGKIATTVSKFAPILSKVKSLFSILRVVMLALSGPIGIVIAAVVALAGVVYLIYKNWDAIGPYIMNLLSGIWNVITTIFGAIVDYVKMFIDSFVTVWMFGWDLLIAIVKPVLEAIWTIIKTVFDAITFAIKLYVVIWATVFNIGLAILKAIFEPIFNALKAVVLFVFEAITAYFNFIFNMWKTIFQIALDAILAIFVPVWEAIKMAVSLVMDVITKIIEVYLGMWKFLFNMGMNVIQNIIIPIFQAIWDFVVLVWTSIVATLQIIWSTIVNLFKTSLTVIGDFFKTIFEGFKIIVSSVLNALIGIVKDLWGKVVDIFKLTKLADIGAAIIDGLVEGIKGGFKKVKDAVMSLTKYIPDWAKDFLDINSPSKVLEREVGEWVPEGVAVGISGNLKPIKRSVEEMTDETIPDIKLPKRSPSSAEVLGDVAHELSVDKNDANSDGGVYEMNIEIPIDGEVLARKTVRFTAKELLNYKKRTERGQ